MSIIVMTPFAVNDKITVFCGKYPSERVPDRLAGKSFVLFAQRRADGTISGSIRSYGHFEHAEHAADELADDVKCIIGNIDELDETECPLCHTDVAFMPELGRAFCGAWCVLGGPEWEDERGLLFDDINGLFDRQCDSGDLK